MKGFTETLLKYQYRLTDRIVDLANGYETSRWEPVSALEAVGPSVDLARMYQGTPYPVLDRIFGRLSRLTDLQNATLCDLGAGKGRVMMMAAEWGVKKAIGVEFSPKMHAACVRNLSRYRKRAPKTRTQFELHSRDVIAYDPDPSIDIFYLYNPFEGEVLGRVMASIEGSLRGRDPVFVYVNPVRSEYFERFGYTRIQEIPSANPNYRVAIYR